VQSAKHFGVHFGHSPRCLEKAIPIGIFPHSLEDGSDRLLFLSEGIQVLTGYEVGYFLENVKNLWDLVLREDLADLQYSLLESLEKRIDWNHDFRLKDKSGHEKWIKASGTPSFQNDKTVWDAVLYDITAQKEAELELLRTKQQLEISIDGSELGLWDWDIKTGKSTYNEYWCSMLGYEFSEVDDTADYFFSLLHPEDSAKLDEQFQAHFRGEIPYIDMEIRLRTKEGGWKWVLDRGKVLRFGKDGTPEYAAGTHLDIDKLKKTEKAYLESQSRFKQLFRQDSDIKFLVNASNGRIIDSNLKAERFFEVTHDFFQGKDFYDFLNFPDDFKLKDFLEKGSKTITVTQLAPDGVIRYMEVYFSPMQEEEKVSLICTLHDITALKMAYQAIEENEERYRLLAENSTDGVATLDEKFRFSYLSPGFMKLMNLEKEFTGNTYQTFIQKIHPDDQPQIRKKMKEAALQKLRKLNFSYRIKNDLEEMIWVEDNLNLIYDQQNRYLKTYINSREITDRVSIQQELEESSNLLSAIISSIREGIIVYDNQGKSILVNDAARKLLQMEEKKQGESFMYLDEENISHNFMSGENDKVVKLIHGEDDHKIIAINYNPVNNAQNEPIGKVSTLTDITDLYHNIEALENTIAEKDVLFKELHHRIKNNLQLVSSLLFIKSVKAKNKDLKQFIRETNDRIKSMSRIHEQLLQNESMSLLRIDHYLSDIAAGLIKSYATIPENIILQTDIISENLHIDKALNLGLIANELISNSLKYAFEQHAKGAISIRLIKQKSNYLFEVADSGKGFDFESTKADSYGLQLVHLFSEQLGGTLTIQSDNGTKFILEFHE
jgi:PAS domain S-box-containing protein